MYIGLHSLRNEAEIRSLRASPGESRQGACNALNRDAGSWIRINYPPRTQRRKRAVRPCEVLDSGSGAVPAGASSGALCGLCVALCGDSDNSGRRWLRDMIMESLRWLSSRRYWFSDRSWSKSWSWYVSRYSSLPSSGYSSSVSTYTQTCPDSSLSDSREPRFTRFLTDSSLIPSLRAASETERRSRAMPGHYTGTKRDLSGQAGKVQWRAG